MNLHSMIPKANFNEEKQTLLVAYCATVERPLLTYSEENSVCLGINYPNFVESLLKTDMARN